jgi:hypothetical protein
VDNVAFRQVFLRVLLLSLDGVIPPALQSHLHPHVAPTRSIKTEVWGLPKNNAVPDVGGFD